VDHFFSSVNPKVDHFFPGVGGSNFSWRLDHFFLDNRTRKPSTDASYYSALTKQLTREDFKVSNLFSLLSEELNWVIKEEYIKRER